MTFTVVVTDRVSIDGLGPLAEDDRFRLRVFEDSRSEGFKEAMATADALVVRSATSVDVDLLESAPRLKVVGRAGVGLDNIDIDRSTERGVVVFNAPDANTVAAAEFTVALILAVARGVPEADRSIREGRWDRSRLVGTELRGKTLGIIGGGRIGGEVARLARAFGMEVVVFDPYLSPERAITLGVESGDLGRVVEDSDVISLHVPLNEETRDLIDADAISRMRPGALIINTSRGGVVDEGALALALSDGRIGGAALDVFETEPLPADSPLHDAPRLVLTPHLGASTREAQRSVALEVARSIKAALVDGDITGAVNAERL
jgi:D-3-phosphoglycerate dehydrogenase / 2-oxoglutarate reductase